MATKATDSWWDLAACQSADPELFFPVTVSGLARADIARAKAVCAGCAIRRQCLDYAIGNHEAHGVWGGTTEDERQVLVARLSMTGPIPTRRCVSTRTLGS
jgi:WhiB family transcriptional regulator, redox-sensing transcriptional regulator